MGRCKKERKCRRLKDELVYKPIGIPARLLLTNEIEPDEFESMRLCDMDGKSQIEAAEKMKISRGTVQRLLISGRAKLMDAILSNKTIKIKNN
ncbi:MAG: DUF134 domain-containing protein [Ignavibacteriae bacterium]|nr:DUF134 domain-containing protein [Ignavibacteriota bacterium]NOG96826.1 DUF134 domain-containing protein [Ignavibacteriota bacterium]